MELDLVIFMGPLQQEMFYDSVNFYQYEYLGRIFGIFRHFWSVVGFFPM